MGKRKSKRKQVKKARAKLETQFTCLFCNHEKSLDVKLYAASIQFCTTTASAAVCSLLLVKPGLPSFSFYTGTRIRCSVVFRAAFVERKHSFPLPVWRHSLPVAPATAAERSYRFGTLMTAFIPLTLKFFGTDLSEPIDVFAMWVDACEEAHKNN